MEQNNSLPVIVKTILESEDIKNIKRIDVVKESVDGIIGVFNYIPIVGGGIASELQQVKNARSSFLEIDFYRKFLALVYGVQDLMPKDIQQFMDEIAEKAKDYAGNIITNHINRIDNVNKAEISANLVRARVEGRINIDDFFRLTSMLERIPYTDLERMLNYQNPYYDPSGDTELLYASGALKLYSIDGNNGNKYVLSNLGIMLLESGMGYYCTKSYSKGTIDKQLETEEL